MEFGGQASGFRPAVAGVVGPTPSSGPEWSTGRPELFRTAPRLPISTIVGNCGLILDATTEALMLVCSKVYVANSIGNAGRLRSHEEDSCGDTTVLNATRKRVAIGILSWSRL